MKVKQCFGIILPMLLCNGLFHPIYAIDEQRQAYDQMVEEATREADEYVEQKQQEHKEAAGKRQKQTDPTFDGRVRAERERLDAEIDKVWNRGLGPDFTEGMRQSRLQELGDKLNRLNSDPQGYFGE